MMYGREERRAFFVSFCGTLTVLTFLAGAAYLAEAPVQQHQKTPVQEEGYLPGHEEDLTLLAVLAEEGREPLFLLTGFYPVEGRTPVTALPPELLVERSGKRTTLQAVFEKEGPQAAREAVCGAFDIAVDRHAQLDRAGVLTLCELLGPVEYELAEAVPIREQAGSVTLEAGSQLLDGKGMAALLFSGDSPGGEEARRTMAAELLAVLLDGEGRTEQQRERAFGALVNAARTDLTAWDREERRQAAEFLRRLRVRTACVVPVEGRWSPDRALFLPDGDSRTLLGQIYGGNSR